MYMSKLYIFMNLHAIEEGKVLFFSDIFSETDIGLKQVSGQAGSSLSVVALFLYDYVC